MNYTNIKQYKKEYRDSHRTELAEKSRIYYSTHKEQVNITNRKNYQLHKKEIMIMAKQSLLIIKTDVLTHYGNGYCKCMRCGFNDIRALSIDHINGSGRKQRETLSNSRSFYNWLKTNNYPSGFQTLCMNCQFIKKKDNFECRHNLVASEPIKE